MRWHGHLLGVLGLSGTFAGAAVLGVVLHADLPVSRRIAAQVLSAWFSSLLNGKVEIAQFRRVSTSQARMTRMLLRDTYGNEVASLDNVRVRLDVPKIVHDVLFPQQSLTVILDHVRVEHADVEFIPDPHTGEPTIDQAILPRAEATATATPPQPPGQAVRVFLPAIELGKVTAHARLHDRSELTAELRNVHGQFLASPKGIAVDVTRFAAELEGLGADARGTGTFSLRAPGAIQGTFGGFVGDVELQLGAYLKANHLDLELDVPRATSRGLAALMPSWPVQDTLSGHAALAGDLPDLHAVATVDAGPAHVEIEGPVRADASPTATLSISGQHLDLQAIAPKAPATDVTLTGVIATKFDGPDLVATMQAHSEQTSISGQHVPPLDVDVQLSKNGATGTGKIHEPGMPIAVSFKVSNGGAVDLEAKTTSFAFERLPRLAGRDVLGTGQATLRAQIEHGTLRASGTADVADLHAAGASLGNARVAVEATGPLDAPEHWTLGVKATGNDARAGSLAVDHVTVNAHGTVAELAFDTNLSSDNGPSVHADGRARLLGGPKLIGAKVSLRRDPVVVEGEIAELDPTEKRIVVKDLHVTGAGGSLTGSARLEPSLVEVEVEGENVDLDALARAFGLPRGMLGGHLRVSANIAAGRDVTRGRVRLGIGNATFGAVAGLSAQVDADLDGKKISGDTSGLVTGFGTFGASWQGELGGPAFEVTSWRDVIGKAEVSFGELPLPALRLLLPKDGPVESIDGQGSARFLLERKTAHASLPNVFATLATRGLAVRVKTKDPKKPLEIQGLDVAMTGGLNGVTGDSTGTTVLLDPRGQVAALTGELRVDVDRLIHAPERALAEVRDTPLDVVLTVGARPFEAFPEFIRPPGVTGAVRGVVSLKGSLSHPTFFASVDGTSLAVVGARPVRLVDAHADAQYDGGTSALSLRTSATLEGHNVLSVAFQGQVPGGAPSTWTGQGRATLDGLPLDLEPSLSKAQIHAQLTGGVTFARAPGSANVAADIGVGNAFVAETPLGEGRLRVATEGRNVEATLGFSGKRGTLDAKGSAGVLWDGPLPGLARDIPIKLSVIAKDFEAGILSPVLEGILGRFGGRFDADVNASLESRPSEDGTAAYVGTVDGTAALRDGSMLIEPLGLEVRGVAVSAEAKGVGDKTTIVLRDLAGRVRSNQTNLEGSADLVLDKLSLESGTAALALNDVPVLLKGAPQGRVAGQATAKLERQKDHMAVAVQIPKLTVKLPQASARKVIDLTDHPDVEIAEAVAASVDSTRAFPWRLAIDLGNDVKVQRSDVDVSVRGTPVVELGSDTTITGSIDLVPGGRLPIVGKVFAIDHGTVVFDTGDSANPHVDITATWRAPTDAVVYVDVTGLLKEAKITLRSDPPLSEPEVFALLLGGSSTEPSATGDPTNANGGAAAGAAAIGSSVAELGVNQLLSNNPVQVRVETTSESLPRYTAAVRVRENLWFEASTYQQTGGATTGNERNVFSGTVDYRFTRRWSLRTEVGTAGGALDLLWQYHY